jgi:L-asparaginase II
MISHPDMVGGPGRFDTLLMEVGEGRILCKGGAEAFQGIGLMPGVLGPDSPALGIAIKISDGDPKSRARPSVVIEVLKQLGALTTDDLEKLSDFGPRLPVLNWRKIVAGESHPTFTLQWNN